MLFNCSTKSRDQVRIKYFQGRHLSTKDLTCTESDKKLTRDGQETQTLDVELGRKYHVHYLYFRKMWDARPPKQSGSTWHTSLGNCLQNLNRKVLLDPYTHSEVWFFHTQRMKERELAPPAWVTSRLMQPELERHPTSSTSIHILSQKVMLEKHPKIYTKHIKKVKSAYICTCNI